jgi:hypothetical protein
MAEKNTREVYLVFKDEADNTVVWPCTISVPLSGGGHQDQIVKARFKVLPDDRMKFFYPSQQEVLALMQKAAATIAAKDQVDAEAVSEPAGRRGDDGLLDEALLGLVDVQGAGSRSEADVAKSLRALPYVMDGLVRGYLEMIGRRVAKN